MVFFARQQENSTELIKALELLHFPAIRGLLFLAYSIRIVKNNFFV